jgi:hypothetical protein
MDELVKMSLEKYEAMREKERNYNKVLSDMEELKKETSKKVEEVVGHILLFAKNIHEESKGHTNIDINNAAKKSGFTATYSYNKELEVKIGDGSGIQYKLTHNGQI